MYLSWNKLTPDFVFIAGHHANPFLSLRMGAAPNANEPLSAKVGEVAIKCSSAVQLQIYEFKLPV